MTLPAANAVLITDFINALIQAGFRGECHQDRAHRLVMSTDNSVYQVDPQAVIYPISEGDLKTLMSVANQPAFMGIQFAPRGGGTGTNGQSLNSCVTVDTSRHLNKIIDIDVEAQRVWVQPGVVLDQLNAALAPHGLFFPPNVSTSSRATIGGMVGTDASGKGSRLYGKTSDYVESMQVVLSDASVLLTRSMQGISERAEAAVSQLKRSVSNNLDEIERRFPKMNRGLTGYNLKQAWDGEALNLNYLFAGSEGSLGLTQRIQLRVVPLPKVVKLVSVGYDDFMVALRDVTQLVPFDPESVEILDDKIMGLAKSDASWHQISDIFGGDTLAAVNFVEFVGEDDASVDAQVKALVDSLHARKGQPGAPVSWTMARDEAQRKALWNIRKKAVGLLGALQGKRRALPFVEDTAVPPEVLADFVAEFRAVLDAQGVAYGMFGHADVGCLHVRPTLDMTDPEDEARLRLISDRVKDLCLKYGGLLWGEHGKGFRGEFSPEFFGPVLWAELQKIKAAFDPDNRFNPGKIVVPSNDIALIAIDEPPMRGHFDRDIAPAQQLGFETAIKCNGNGLCFGWDADEAMCPSYKLSRDRTRSPKGRAMLLKEWRRLQSLGDSAALAELEPQLAQSLDDCLSCKSCTGSCPVKVNIPDMKSQFLQHWHQTRRRPLRDRLLASLEPMGLWLSKVPTLSNLAMRAAAPVIRAAGLTELPMFSNVTAAAVLRKHGVAPFAYAQLDNAPDNAVVLVQDSFTSFFDTAVLDASIQVLKSLGYAVIATPIHANGKGLHVKGMRSAFREVATTNQAMFERLTASGLPLIGIEGVVNLIGRSEACDAGLAGWHVQSLQEFLVTQSLPTRLDGVRAPDLFAHCTEKTALGSMNADWQAVFAALGATLPVAQVGCCGMSGVYGHETEHRDGAVKLFNMSWGDKVSADSLVTGFSCRCQVKAIQGTRPRHPIEWVAEQLAALER